MIQLWDPADAGYAMNKIAELALSGHRDSITAGLNLGIAGYDNLIIPDPSRPQLLFGSGWITITKDNMADYNF